MTPPSAKQHDLEDIVNESEILSYLDTEIDEGDAYELSDEAGEELVRQIADMIFTRFDDITRIMKG